MTIREVLTQVDDLKPNSYTEEDKLVWLKEVENKIYQDIVCTHEDAVAMTDFKDDSNDLIAHSPYDNLYVSYLCAKIDFFNRETEGYNNQMIMFNTEYQGFANWYNRNHMPKEM